MAKWISGLRRCEECGLESVLPSCTSDRAQTHDCTDSRYRIQPARPEAHLFSISCELCRSGTRRQVFSLPAWIPGSYMIRRVRPQHRQHPCRVGQCGTPTKTGQAQLACWSRHRRCNIAVSPKFRGGRFPCTAHLDQTHAFFWQRVFYCPKAGRSAQCPVEIHLRGPEFRPCKLATAMEDARGHVGAARRQ